MSTNRAWLRPVLYLVGLALLSAGLIAVTTGPARAATSVHHPDTTVTVLRPVTASGHAAQGWRVVTDDTFTVTCWATSDVAVDGGVADCGPTAAGANACWKSATPGHVLCVDYDGTHRVLRSMRYTGTFGKFKPVAHPVPDLLRMRNGMLMQRRIGGAWGPCAEHPTWVGYYIESAHGHTIYAPESEHSGLNQQRAGWFGTVYANPETGTGYHAWVTTAYFVGTAR